jgi:Arc/MetJ family transcription regulator
MMHARQIHHQHRRWAISITQIDIDDDALAEAMRLTGTSTKKDTVNTALREYAARIKQLQAAEKLVARAARGEFDAPWAQTCPDAECPARGRVPGTA